MGLVAKLFGYFFLFVALIIFVYLVMYIYAYIHECAHEAIFKNWGVRIKKKKIEFKHGGRIHAETIADKEDLKKLDKISFYDLQRTHANIEIINYIFLSLFLLVLFTLFLIKLLFLKI